MTSYYNANLGPQSSQDAAWTVWQVDVIYKHGRQADAKVASCPRVASVKKIECIHGNRRVVLCEEGHANDAATLASSQQQNRILGRGTLKEHNPQPV